MPRVLSASPGFCEAYLPGEAPLEVEAATVFELVRKLDAASPGFGTFIEGKIALAVDGVLVSDWSMPLTPVSEVLLVPRVAGGRA